MRRVVSFHYTLTDPSARMLDSSAGGLPVTYLEGAGQIIDGLDEQLRACPAGAKVRVQVPAAKAYGEPDPTQVQRVKRTLLPVDGELKVGDIFQAGEDRHAPVVKVVAIEGDEVLLDLTLRMPASEDAGRACAGWDAHLEMLAAALAGVPIKFPFELFKAARDAYRAQLAPN